MSDSQPPADSAQKLTDNLTQLAAMHAQGQLTDAQFERAKDVLFERASAPAATPPAAVSPSPSPSPPISSKPTPSLSRAIPSRSIEGMLLPEEKLVLSADLHPLVAFAPLALPLAGAAVVFLAFLGTGFLAGVVAAMVIFGLVGGPLAIAGWLRLRTTEFALTTRRVIMITGVIQRHSREILIDQVEGVGVTQSLLDRLLASGSLVVTGTGAGQTPIGGIRDAYEVRRKVASWLEANRVR